MVNSLYDRIASRFYDRFVRASENAGLRDRRRRLLAEARGDTLEIGAGTGANLEYFDKGLESLTLVEPSRPMARKMRRRLAKSDGSAGDVRVVDAPAERLPLPDDAFDTAISTLVLCTVEDPVAALAELRRVLKPGGKLLFIEHVRSEDPRVAKRQDKLWRIWRAVGQGCVCNRETERAIRDAGFTIESLEHGDVPKAPDFLRPLIQGVAINAKKADSEHDASEASAASAVSS